MDLQPLNIRFTVPCIKFESLALLSFLSLAGNKVIGVDLQPGHYALGIDPLHQQFMCFCVDGLYYCYSALRYPG